MKDFYKILGVDRSASEGDIKKAYRKLSKEFHPDRQSGKTEAEKKNAEEKMKEINEAYETLSDKEKRYNYDNGGHNPFQGFGGGPDMGDFDPFHGFNPFGRYDDTPRVQKGSDIQMKIPVGINEILNGCDKKVRYKRQVRCTECGGKGGTGKTVCPYCHGTGSITETKSWGPNRFFQKTTVCPHCGGRGFKFEHTCQHCHETGFVDKEEILNIHFDPGIVQGMAFECVSKGNESPDEKGPNGDFYAIPIYNVDPSKYNLDNFPHIIHKVKINWIDAILGGKYNINLEGIGNVEVNISECTKPGDSVVLPGKGARIKRNDFDFTGSFRGDMVGDYILNIDYATPKKLSEKQKKILEQLKNCKD